MGWSKKSKFLSFVPSFRDWGCYLAWHPAVKKKKSSTIDVPTKFIKPEVFKRPFVFGKGELEMANTLIKTILHPSLLSIYNNESRLLE